MKKPLIVIALLTGILFLESCKGKVDETTKNAETKVESEVPTSETEDPNVLQPKSYKVVVATGTPEVILLGKKVKRP